MIVKRKKEEEDEDETDFGDFSESDVLTIIILKPISG